MPDIFDQVVNQPKGDIFDQVAAQPGGDIFDRISAQRSGDLPGITPPQINPQPVAMSQAERLGASASAGVSRAAVALAPQFPVLAAAVASPWAAPAQAMAQAKASGLPHDATRILPDPQTAQAINQASVQRTLSAVQALSGPQIQPEEIDPSTGQPRVPMGPGAPIPVRQMINQQPGPTIGVTKGEAFLQPLKNVADVVEQIPGVPLQAYRALVPEPGGRAETQPVTFHDPVTGKPFTAPAGFEQVVNPDKHPYLRAAYGLGETAAGAAGALPAIALTGGAGAAVTPELISGAFAVEGLPGVAKALNETSQHATPENLANLGMQSLLTGLAVLHATRGVDALKGAAKDRLFEAYQDELNRRYHAQEADRAYGPPGGEQPRQIEQGAQPPPGARAVVPRPGTPQPPQEAPPNAQQPVPRSVQVDRASGAIEEQAPAAATAGAEQTPAAGQAAGAQDAAAGQRTQEPVVGDRSVPAQLAEPSVTLSPGQAAFQAGLDKAAAGKAAAKQKLLGGEAPTPPTRENLSLTSEEQDVQTRASENLAQNLRRLVEEYRSKFGDEISTDNAREIVSPDYAGSVEARTRWSAATQQPAGELADRLFEQALQRVDPNKPRLVVMTSGGTGAGKTTLLADNAELPHAQFTYDSNLSGRQSSVQKIEAAKAAGNRVEIRFVHRDPVEALTGGVLPRAMAEGRVVPLEAHGRMYRDSVENFRYLIRKYAGDPNVRFSAIDNSHGPEGARLMPLEAAQGLRYSTTELQPRLRAALDREYAEGRISEQVYRATLGSSSPEAPGGLPRDPGSGSPPAGGEGSPRAASLGDAGRVGGGQSQPERSQSDEPTKSQPGGVSSPGQAMFQAAREKAAAAKAAAKAKLMGERSRGNGPENEVTAEAPPAAAQPIEAAADQPGSELETKPEASPPADAGPVTLGSGLGAFEPPIRETIEEGRRLAALRKAGQEAAKKLESTPEQKHAGELALTVATSERDLFAARLNQKIYRVLHRILTDIKDREALMLYRQFKRRPEDLARFAMGMDMEKGHQVLHDHKFRVEQMSPGGLARKEAQPYLDAAIENLERLRPVMDRAMGWIRNGLPPNAAAADKVFTSIAEYVLDEGQKGGWLDSRWENDEYVPDLLHKAGAGLYPVNARAFVSTKGKIGHYDRFAQRRSDEYPTILHAIADGRVPQTLDIAAAFTVAADAHATTRATHILEEYLVSWNLGVMSDGKSTPVPQGWEPFSAHNEEFKNIHAYVDDENGQPKVAMSRMYAPPFINEALGPLINPDFTANLKVKKLTFRQVRAAQRQLKECILSLSMFHLLTEQYMAAADMGPSGMWKAFRTDRFGPELEANERKWIGWGMTTAIQGSVMSAYRGLTPGSIPTRGEIFLAYTGSKIWKPAAEAVTRLTFENVQRRFKVVSAELHRLAWLNKNPVFRPEEEEAAMRGIASYVNGVYGGLHWENMGWEKGYVELARLFLLAPDWSFSNVALAKYAADDLTLRPSQLLSLQAHIGNLKALSTTATLKGATTKEITQARLARLFWTKQLLGGLLATVATSLLFWGARGEKREALKDEAGKMLRHPLKVYMGQDQSGNDIYSNMYFRGSIGDATNWATRVSDQGLVSGSGTFIGTKAAPFTKAGIHRITGRDDLGRKRNEEGLNWMVKNLRDAGFIVADVSPAPISARGAVSNALDDNYSWSEVMLNLLGVTTQHVAPEGEKVTDRGLRAIRPNRQPENSIWDQMRTGKLHPSRRGGR